MNHLNFIKSRPYIDELKKRLVAEQLKHIATTYWSISALMFSQLLGSPDSLDEVMSLCLWTLGRPLCCRYAQTNPKYRIYSRIQY
jgi:hypothetical protein